MKFWVKVRKDPEQVSVFLLVLTSFAVDKYNILRFDIIFVQIQSTFKRLKDISKIMNKKNETDFYKRFLLALKIAKSRSETKINIRFK